MISTEEENRAVQCLYDFIYYFNIKDRSKILNSLHYPHMAQSDNNDPTIYKNEKSDLNPIYESFRYFVSHIIIFFKRIIYQYFLIDFNPGSFSCIWVATKKNGHWGLQIRAMIPIAGRISILAGAKLKD